MVNGKRAGSRFLLILVLTTGVSCAGLLACGGKDLSVAGLSGFKCVWEFMGKKHLGIFLEEELDGPMSIIHFVDCQSPGNDFEKHKGDFERIVASLKK